MGDKQDRLKTILTATGSTLTSGILPIPRLEILRTSSYYQEVVQIYEQLGGVLPTFELNLRKWDLEVDGIAVELDEQLHFNRYRGITLTSGLYSELPEFPMTDYVEFCRHHEHDCLKAGGYGGKWANSSTIKQFGIGDQPGKLDKRGSPRWKQRAFYDFVKDLSPLVISTSLVRISVWDMVQVGSHRIQVMDGLRRNDPGFATSLSELIRIRVGMK